MNIGFCGNIDCSGIANALDTRMPGCDIITGGPLSYADELSDPPAEFRALDIMIIALDWSTLAPQAYSFAPGTDPADATSDFTAACDHVGKLIAAYRAIRPVAILLFTPVSPPLSTAGMIDRLLAPGMSEFFAGCQQTFNTLCRSFTDVYPVDLNELTRCTLGTGILSEQSSAELIAQRIADTIVQIKNGPLKCMVLDCDDTLWGGTVAEDGTHGIILSSEEPGAHFKRFQEVIRTYHRQGVLIALCSKNNTCDVLETLQGHPHMVIRPDMISCYRINWDEKPHSLRGIAAELNIGLDSMLFIDNDPAQRAIMRAMLPQVTVLDLPDDPALYADALLKCTRLWPLRITQEDRQRGKQYVSENKRRQAQVKSIDTEKFLRDSHIRATVTTATPETIDRINQLFNKTNQFNLTGRRYTQIELEQVMQDPACRVYAMSMIDDWGDYGIICAAVVRSGVIEAFALSCRVFGRKAEHAFIAAAASLLKKDGVHLLTGVQIQTPRNAMTREFYGEIGFTLSGDFGERREWRIDLEKLMPVGPEWIVVE